MYIWLLPEKKEEKKWFGSNMDQSKCAHGINFLVVAFYY